MKRILSIAAFVLVMAAGYYAYLHPEKFGFGGPPSLSGSGNSPSAEVDPTAHIPRITWQPIDRTGDGFKVEMPEDPRQLQVPAYNDAGVSEPVNMIVSSPGSSANFAVAWSDDPPAMRLSNRAADTTLDTARDGLLARTQTSLVNELRTSPQGFAGRDILARNIGGGVLDARLIFAGQRLYMLTAAYPSMSARLDQDVKHFFNSFSVISPASHIPASQPTP